MTRKNNAIYIDLENIPTALDLKLLIDELTLRHNENPDEENIFVIKMACGNSSSIKRLEKQLVEYNFTIRDTPSITATH
ncbi:MAG TPA: NYN domain-containing protein, partial [Sphaerochaeta sp.]|nr:NYN domain-containing protein [Sphaerochaeta sp.]